MLRSRYWWPVACTLVFVSSVLHAPSFASWPSGWRQNQTLLLIDEFVRNGVDVRSPLPLFGVRSPFLPMEFPLFQVFASSLTQLLSLPSDAAARLLSLMLFQVSAVLWAILIKRWFSPATSLIALVLYQFLGYGFVHADEPLIEWLPVALILLALLLYNRYLHSPRLLLVVLMTAALALAFLTKTTTGVALAPLFLIPLLNLRAVPTSTCSVHRAAWVASIAMVTALLASTAWTRYADHVKANQPLTGFMTSSSLTEWNFGTLSQRGDPETWASLLSQWGLFGSFWAFPIAAVVAIVAWKWAPATVIFPLIPFFAVGIFFNLYVRHHYYQMAIYPVLVGILAVAVGGILKSLSQQPIRTKLLVGGSLVMGLIAGSWNTPQVRTGIEDLVSAVKEPSWMLDIVDHVSENEGIVAIGCSWDPTLAAVTRRPTLMVSSTAAADYFEGGVIAFCSEPAEGYETFLLNNMPIDIQFVRIKEGLYAYRL